MPNTPTLDKVRELFDAACVDWKAPGDLYEWRVSANIVRDLARDINPDEPRLAVDNFAKNIISRGERPLFSIACIIVHDEDDVLELNRKGS